MVIPQARVSVSNFKCENRFQYRHIGKHSGDDEAHVQTSSVSARNS